MVDLALGFIIGSAFATPVDSLAGDVIMQPVAAIFQQPDVSRHAITLDGSEIRYGGFRTVLVEFPILAAVLFGLVTRFEAAGPGNLRA